MINQLNSGGAQSFAAMPSAQAYAQGLSKYGAPSLGSSPFGQVAGSAIGAMAQQLAANPELAKQLGSKLKNWMTDSQAPAPVENGLLSSMSSQIPMQPGGGY